MMSVELVSTNMNRIDVYRWINCVSWNPSISRIEIDITDSFPLRMITNRELYAYCNTDL